METLLLENNLGLGTLDVPHRIQLFDGVHHKVNAVK